MLGSEGNQILVYSEGRAGRLLIGPPAYGGALVTRSLGGVGRTSTNDKSPERSCDK